MRKATGIERIRPAWWTLILVAVISTIVVLCTALFYRSFDPYVPITVVSDRSGLVMETGAKVRMRGEEVGRVADVSGGQGEASLRLKINPDAIEYIPANIGAQIRATTIFGSKYVDLVYPEHPTAARLARNAVLHSANVTTEVNTVFQNLVAVLHEIDPGKLNAVLGALAEAVRGQGPVIGQAITDANQVLLALNARSDTIAQDWRSLRGFSDAWSAATGSVLATVDAASTTATTLTSHATDLDALLLNAIGLSRSGINLLAPNEATLVRGVNDFQSTTDLLLKYNPELTCVILGGKWILDNGSDVVGGNGYSSILDSGMLLGSDPYRYPDNLPIVAAKGGPGGKPGCGSLPDASKAYPVRQLVTNTGWGTGMDIRPNPGIGFPAWMNLFPVTRAVPEPPSVRNYGGPAPGPVVPPGVPPYGAPQHPSPEPTP